MFGPFLSMKTNLKNPATCQWSSVSVLVGHTSVEHRLTVKFDLFLDCAWPWQMLMPLWWADKRQPWVCGMTRICLESIKKRLKLQKNSTKYLQWIRQHRSRQSLRAAWWHQLCSSLEAQRRAWQNPKSKSVLKKEHSKTFYSENVYMFLWNSFENCFGFF